MDMFKDKVKIIRINGDVINDVRASVQKKIHIPDVSVAVDEGDVIEQVLPSGIIKRMVVTDTQVYSGYSPRLDRIEVEYERE